MKKIHLLNIGYPKSGTSWIWEHFCKLPEISIPMEKENKRFFSGQPLENYIACYNKWDMTGNFFTYNFALDRYRLKQLSSIDTARASFILRHPVDLAWSLYFFLKIDQSQTTFPEYCIQLLDQSWFFSAHKIINRWQEQFGERFHIFYYEDFVKDNKQFFSVFCQEMLDLDCNTIEFNNTLINSTNYCGQHKPYIGPVLTNRFNMHIEELQKVVDKDLSHWRLTV